MACIGITGHSLTGQIRYWLEQRDEVSIQYLRILAIEVGAIYSTSTREQLITLLQPLLFDRIMSERRRIDLIRRVTNPIVRLHSVEDMKIEIINISFGGIYSLHAILQMLREGIQKELYNTSFTDYEMVVEAMSAAVYFYIINRYLYEDSISNVFEENPSRSPRSVAQVPEDTQPIPQTLDNENTQQWHRIQHCSMAAIDEETEQANLVFDCCICMSLCPSMKKVTTNCNHSFCVECVQGYIDTCTERDLTCPMCRTKIMNVTLYDVEIHNEFKIKNGL
jgi:hypothetical protein